MALATNRTPTVRADRVRCRSTWRKANSATAGLRENIVRVAIQENGPRTTGIERTIPTKRNIAIAIATLVGKKPAMEIARTTALAKVRVRPATV